MVGNILRGAHALVAVIRVVAGALLIGSVTVNFANIIGRYFLSVSIPWAEEVMLFLMVGCVFLGSGLVGWSGRQIRMDAIVSLLPPRLRAGIELVCDLVLIATSIVLAILAWPVVAMLAEFDQRSQAANIPLALPQATLPIGFLILAFLVAVRLIARIKSGARVAAAHADHPAG
jgi:C4-dicarboxylate transporter, DctQ subunit